MPSPQFLGFAKGSTCGLKAHTFNKHIFAGQHMLIFFCMMKY